MSYHDHKDMPATNVIKECSEVIKEICEAQQSGWFNYHPAHPKETHAATVMKKMDDIVNIMEELEAWIRKESYNLNKQKVK